LSIGHDFKKGPMKNGCRKWLIFFIYHIYCTFYLFIAGITTTKKHIDVDYSEYLGEHYKKYAKKIKKASTIVCNHVSWLDPVVLIKEIKPAFSASAEFKNLPLLATLIDTLDSIYIPRGGSEEKRAHALSAIRDR
jgi:1-acyl-sn-glycerol-3-phosphate acyltransferase